MFVFKAAVVGAGTMGGQIAQTIAAAGIPVVLKDIRQDLVDAGLAEARQVTERPGRQARREGEAHRGAGRRAGRRDRSACITGTTTYDGFGDVDFVVEAVPERMEIKQAVFAELDAVHARPRDPRVEHLVAVDHRDRRRDAASRQGRRLPLLLPGVDHAADRDRRGRRHLRRDAAGDGHLRPGDQEAADHVPRGPGLRRQPDPQLGRSARSGARRRRATSRSRRSTRASARPSVVPVGPYLLVEPARPRHRPARRRAPRRVLRPERFYVPHGMQKLVAEGKLGAKTGGDGFYAPDGSANLPGEGEPDVAELVELLTLKTFVEACLVLEEGVATHRDIDFGMMAGAGLDPRRGLLPPFMGADVAGLDVDARAPRGRRRAPRRALRAADDPAPPRRPGPSGHEDRPGLLRLPAARRRAARRRGGRREARDARRRGDRVAGERPDELDRRRRSSRTSARSGRASRATRRPRARHRLVEPDALLRRAPTSRRSRSSTRPAGRALARRAPTGCCASSAARASSRSRRSTASPSAAAASWRWPATCASPRGRRSSASRRSSSGSSPASAAPSGCRAWSGENKALEMNLVGDPIGAEEAFDYGLVNRVVTDHELLDTALAWARRLAEQAPLAVEAIKDVSAQGRPRRGHRGREGGVRARSSPPRTRARASAPSSASASRTGRGRERRARRAGGARAPRGPHRARPARSSR